MELAVIDGALDFAAEALPVLERARLLAAAEGAENLVRDLDGLIKKLRDGVMFH